MAKLFFRSRRYLLGALLVLLAAVGARAQAPEFSYWERTPLPQQGLATYYNPGVMEQVLDYRVNAGDIGLCPECVGTVALLRAGDIGRKVWLQPPGGDPVGPFLVVDCARREDVQPLLDRNWVVDVSFEVGQYWGMNRPLDGVIVFEDPADQGPDRSVGRIPTPFVVAPDEVVISAPMPTPTAPPLPAGLPTAWPTRRPVPLVPQTGNPVPASPTPVPTPTAIWPPPLTPVITTPTPLATLPATAVNSDYTPETGATSTPAATPTEVSLGRPGGALLAQYDASPLPAQGTAAVPLVTDPSVTRAAPTARPTLVRTPRPNLTPILPLAVTPSATPTPDPGFFDRVLRDLFGHVR